MVSWQNGCSRALGGGGEGGGRVRMTLRHAMLMADTGWHSRDSPRVKTLRGLTSSSWMCARPLSLPFPTCGRAETRTRSLCSATVAASWGDAGAVCASGCAHVCAYVCACVYCVYTCVCVCEFALCMCCVCICMCVLYAHARVCMCTCLCVRVCCMCAHAMCACVCVSCTPSRGAWRLRGRLCLLAALRRAPGGRSWAKGTASQEACLTSGKMG